MKRQIKILVSVLVLITTSHFASAQEYVTIVTPNLDVAEGLDLRSVAELFKDSNNLEEFERVLNDPRIGINNLDLDEDGYVDYIRVLEQRSGYTRVIILQVALGRDEFQDIATIEIERTRAGNYNMQIRGNDVIYGVDYYVSPIYVHVHHIHRWPIITWIFRPGFYYPYRSVFYFGYYPVWWTPYRPVIVRVYHSHIERYRRQATFEACRFNRVETVHKLNYKPQISPRVNEKAQAIRTAPERIRRETDHREQPGTMNRGFGNETDNPGKTPRSSEALKNPEPGNTNNNIVDQPANQPRRSELTRNRTVRNEPEKIARPQAESRTTVRSQPEKVARPQTERNPAIRKESGQHSRPPVEQRATNRSRPEKIARPPAERNPTIRNEPGKSTKPQVAQKPAIRSQSDKVARPPAEKKTATNKDNNKRQLRSDAN